MQDMTALTLGQYHLADIFKPSAELFYRSELFDDVVVSALDRASQSLIGVSAWETTPRCATASAFRFCLRRMRLTNRHCQRPGHPDFRRDSGLNRARIPEWYTRAFADQPPAHAFLLLPVMVNNKPWA